MIGIAGLITPLLNGDTSMSSQQVIIIAVVLVLIALSFGYVIGASRSVDTPIASPEPKPEPEPITTEEEEPVPERPYISRETVEGLYYGLTYEAAEKKFGFPSDETESEYDRGVEGYTSPFVIYWHVWNNEDGSRARLGFVENKLERKQFIAADGNSEIPLPPHLDVKNYDKILGIDGEGGSGRKTNSR